MWGGSHWKSPHSTTGWLSTNRKVCGLWSAATSLLARRKASDALGCLVLLLAAPGGLRPGLDLGKGTRRRRLPSFLSRAAPGLCRKYWPLRLPPIQARAVFLSHGGQFISYPDGALSRPPASSSSWLSPRGAGACKRNPLPPFSPAKVAAFLPVPLHPRINCRCHSLVTHPIPQQFRPLPIV